MEKALKIERLQNTKFTRKQADGKILINIMLHGSKGTVEMIQQAHNFKKRLKMRKAFASKVKKRGRTGGS